MSATAPDTLHVPGCKTPEQAARFMAEAAKKGWGSPPAVPSPAEVVQHFAGNAGHIPSADTPEAVAAFVASVRPKTRTVAVASPAVAPRVPHAAEPDMDSADGVAAFILSAGRRGSRPRDVS